MKIVIIGGTGLIGSKLVSRLHQQGHEVFAASPASGVNTITGQGLAKAVDGAQVVADVANASSFDDKAVLEFFETSGRNLLTAEAYAGVNHHIALSVAGTHRLQDSGYFRAKAVQEKLIRQSGIPYTIVHATLFFEFVSSVAQAATQDQRIHVSPALVQPIAADEAAAILADVCTNQPLNATIEVAGPERLPLDELIRTFLELSADKREVVTDINARYFGARLNTHSLIPGEHPRLGTITYRDWFNSQHTKR